MEILSRKKPEYDLSSDFMTPATEARHFQPDGSLQGQVVELPVACGLAVRIRTRGSLEASLPCLCATPRSLSCHKKSGEYWIELNATAVAVAISQFALDLIDGAVIHYFCVNPQSHRFLTTMNP